MPRGLLAKRNSASPTMSETSIKQEEDKELGRVRHASAGDSLISHESGNGTLLPSPPIALQNLTARLSSEADYARYKACKDSTETFYSRLATLSALHSYGYYFNPLTIMSQYHQALLQQQQLLASPTSQPPPTTPDLEDDDSNRKRSLPDGNEKPVKRSKSTPKKKSSRRLAFDEDKTSPVSGTIIRERAEGEEIPAIHKGDIDPEFNVVEVTDEAKAELAKIENKIGDFVCRLCKEVYDDAFGLAQHRCNMIVHVEYRCPECDKVFNCPANLASHRRWHKPKAPVVEENNNDIVDVVSTSADVSCDVCKKKFKRLHSLRKHIQLHCQQADTNSISSSSSSSTSSSPGKSSNYSIAELLSSPKQVCQVCGLEFHSLVELENHKKLLHSNNNILAGFNQQLIQSFISRPANIGLAAE